MTVYMKVTQDEYELPLAIASTVQELADICGTSANNIRSTMSRHKSGKFKKTKYVKVEVSEEDE